MGAALAVIPIIELSRYYPGMVAAMEVVGPIGEFQLIQLKLARMELARLNIENLVVRQIEMAAAGRSLSLAEASAQTAMAVALLALDANVLIQVSQIARSLLGAA